MQDLPQYRSGPAQPILVNASQMISPSPIELDQQYGSDKLITLKRKRGTPKHRRYYFKLHGRSKTVNSRLSTTVLQSMQVDALSRHKETLKNCITKLRTLTQVKDINALNPQHRHIINDLGSDFPENARKQLKDDLYETKFQKLYQNSQTPANSKGGFHTVIMRLLREKPSQLLTNSLLVRFLQLSLRPSHPLIVSWNLCKIFLIIHTFFAFPIGDVFGSEFKVLECQKLSYLIKFEFAFLIIDIILRFNMAFYSKGELIQDKKLIAKLYLQTGFISDFIAVVSFTSDRYQMILPHEGHECSSFGMETMILSFPKYLFFLKLSQMKKFLKFFHQEVDKKHQYRSYIELTKLLLLVIMMAHAIVIHLPIIGKSCCWVAVAKISSAYFDTNWIVERKLTDKPWHHIYFVALYFACMTMTTVGYGDVLPQNEMEYIVCMIIMLISCGIFAYTLNTITSVLQNINKATELYKQDLQAIEQYMRKKDIDIDLQRRVKKYLKSMWQSGQIDPQNHAQGVFDRLSLRLQNDIQLQDKGKILLSVPFLVNNFTLSFLKRLMKVVQEVNYSPQEIIINPEDQADSSQGLFIVYSGKCEMIYEKDGQVIQICSLEKGNSFGLKNLLQIKCNRFTVRSMDFTTLYYISHEDFTDIVQEEKTDQIDFERYCMVRDELLFQENEVLLSQVCLLCSKPGHEINHCPIIFHCHHKQLALMKHIFSTAQSRVSFQRPRRLKENSRIKMKYLKEVGVYDLSDWSGSGSQESQFNLAGDCINNNNHSIIEEEDESSNMSNKSWQIRHEALDVQVLPDLNKKATPEPPYIRVVPHFSDASDRSPPQSLTSSPKRRARGPSSYLKRFGFDKEMEESLHQSSFYCQSPDEHVRSQQKKVSSIRFRKQSGINASPQYLKEPEQSSLSVLNSPTPQRRRLTKKVTSIKQQQETINRSDSKKPTLQSERVMIDSGQLKPPPELDHVSSISQPAQFETPFETMKVFKYFYSSSNYEQVVRRINEMVKRDFKRQFTKQQILKRQTHRSSQKG